ncbi:MAG: response regulator transcription factor [Chitinophagaceae bacterium]|nr:response regulator transcription factor [Chitinophagaceae bacterium]
MIKAIIVDDEQHCIDRLTNLLQQYHSGTVQLLASASSVKEGIKVIREHQPDLIFLDVQIHDRTGFDLLRECGTVNFNVIFTTAYDKFAIQAIKFSAIGYLLKPIDEDDLQEALDKLKDISVENTGLMAAVIENNLQPASKKKKLTIPSGNELLFVNIDDIIRCHSDINYTTIFKTDNQKIVVAKTLKEFEELLSDHNFFRVHNSELINLGYIKSYNKGKGGSVLLTDGTELEVSTRRKDDFLKR